MSKIKRPILVAVIGYIIGILMGLYFNISIALLYVPIIAIYLIKTNFIKSRERKNFKLLSLKRFFRYVKLILNSKVILLIMISSIISNSIVIIKNQKYNKLYNQKQISGEALVVSDKTEKEYHNRYIIKYKDTYLYLNVSKKFLKDLKYGDKIKINSDFLEPNSRRNFGGFDYKQYLKTLKICGYIKTDKIEITKREQGNQFFRLSNKVSKKFKNIIEENLEKNQAEIIKGILLGDNSKIEEQVKERFRASSISHILAVSGMHVTYLIIGINLLLKKQMGKRKIHITLIVILIIYMFITGFSPSIARAGIMGILLTGSKILYRKNDIWTAISISMFLILIYNPFLITNIGLQFSYLGTIGIVVLYKNILIFLKGIKIKNKKWKYRFNGKAMNLVNKIKEIMAVSISAQLAIMPVILYHFNLFEIYFLITNLLVSVIIGPIIIIGTFTLILPSVFSNILKILVNILVLISKIGELPFSKIYLPTPKIYIIIFYYLSIVILNYIYSIYNLNKFQPTGRRVRNIIALTKYKIKQSKKKKVIFCYIIILITVINIIMPKNMKVHFVDIGQGDSTFIITPHNKTILIDGGGSFSENWNVGKNVLVPYILDRGYTKIDYIFISHFDQDHVRTEF